MLYTGDCCLGFKGNVCPENLTIKEGTRLFVTDGVNTQILTIPKSVTYIDGDSYVADICYIYNQTPPIAKVQLTNRLFVPKGSLVAYSTTEPWSAAEQIIEFEVDDVVKPVLTIAYPEGGVVKQKVDNGEILELQIVPLSGWKCHSVTFNGVDVTAQLDVNGNYNTPSITADSKLNIVFVKNDGSVANTFANEDIKVSVVGNTITIVGADEFAEVEIYNTAGMIVYTGTEKTITLDGTGVYILTVDGYTFKFAM